MVCQRVAPMAKLASRMPIGMERRASIVSVVMVGTIMMASTSHTVSAPKPRPPVALATSGRSTTSPKKPYTTEGTPASRSTAVLTTPASRLPEISVRKTAQPTASGTPMASAPTVTMPDPASRARMP